MRRRNNNENILLAISIISLALSIVLAVLLVKKSSNADFSRNGSDIAVIVNNNEDSSENAKSDTHGEFSPKMQTLRESLSLTDEDMEYLVLVNFENSFDSGNVSLKPNSYVFDERFCTYCNRSCNETAGRALNELFRSGCAAGYGRFIVNSAFRDRREQTEIWEEKRSKDPHYGDNPYDSPVRAMPPGKSEHETGLAFDVLTEEHPFANKWFGTFEDGIWLREHCAEYGFILRYPEDKAAITGVQYEPWHFRYVGVKAAEYMYEHNLCLEEFLLLLDKETDIGQ